MHLQPPDRRIEPCSVSSHWCWSSRWAREVKRRPEPLTREEYLASHVKRFELLEISCDDNIFVRAGVQSR